VRKNDGHQARSKTIGQVQKSRKWRIIKEKKDQLACAPK